MLEDPMSIEPVRAVIEFERTFLPLLHEAERAVASAYPRFKFSVGSSSIGSLTEYQGHIAWLECIFPDAADHEANSVVLMIGVKHVTTEPELCSASVEWGSGLHPDVMLELLEHPVALTEVTLRETAMHFPQLTRVFRNALEAWVARDAHV
jgi:hypothetical protein